MTKRALEVRQQQYQELSAGDEYLYYNFNLVNNSDVSVPCSFLTSLGSPLLSNATEYYLTTVRFVLDGTTIPIFVFQDGVYFVTLSWNGNDVAAPVIYTPYYPVNGQKSVFSYQSFINMINDALQTAFTAISAIVGFPADVTEAPYMVYVPATGLCPFFAQITYPANVSGFPVKVYMNTRLYNFFGNFLVNYAGTESLTPGPPMSSHKNYEIVIQNLKNSNVKSQILFVPTNYYMMPQEYSSLFLWFDITGVIFTSNTIGVAPEYFPTQNASTTQLATANSGGTGPASTSMITDFQPYYAPGDAAGVRSYLYYAPSQYRLINLQKNFIQSLDLTIQLRDRVGTQYQYFIPPHQSAQVKIGFIKRSAANGASITNKVS